MIMLSVYLKSNYLYVDRALCIFEVYRLEFIVAGKNMNYRFKTNSFPKLLNYILQIFKNP